VGKENRGKVRKRGEKGIKGRGETERKGRASGVPLQD